MSTKRIMLFGASGQIGQAVRAEALPALWELGSYTRAEVDMTDHKGVHEMLQNFRPDLIINAAAMTAVDRCESEHAAARAANFEAPSNLALQCAAYDIPLVHISTDYVFDGTDGGQPYKTDDPMSPLNAYGHTKMMGEEAVRHGVAWHVILRVSSVFSEFGSNLLTKNLAAIEQKDEIKAVTDQTAAPTYAPEIAKAIIKMADAILGGKTDGFGTFHLTGTPAATRFEFVSDIMKAYEPFTTRRPKITEARTSDFPGLAPRPAYSVLDCSRIERVYGIHPRPWHEGLMTALEALEVKKRAVA